MKLLNKSIGSYLIYACCMLLIAVPVFYFAVQQLVSEDVDESLIAQKAVLKKKFETMTGLADATLMNFFEPNFTISPTGNHTEADRFYNEKIYDSVSSESIPYRTLETNVKLESSFYTIQLRSSLLDSKELIQSLLIVVMILVVLIITGLIVINRLISKKLWAPFYGTLQALNQHRVDDPAALTLPQVKIDEFQDLNRAISALAERNQQVFRSQKEFAENASHEMQTPLAIMQNNAELLMQTVPLTMEQAELIEGLSYAGLRLGRLNKTLLLLSKIDNGQFPEKDDINLGELMPRLLDQYAFPSSAKNLSLDVRITGACAVSANPTLMEILLGNLISNAVRHNIQNGEIHVVVNENGLEISNTGKEKTLDKSRLFQRFQKQTHDNNSVGLGLELVKKICLLNNFDIMYSFETHLHRFRLTTAIA